LNTWRLLKEADLSGFLLKGKELACAVHTIYALAGLTSHILANNLTTKNCGKTDCFVLLATTAKPTIFIQCNKQRRACLAIFPTWGQSAVFKAFYPLFQL
jgi:hypothetical protein